MGYAFSKRIDTQLTLAALDMAYRRRKPAKGLIFHSDRGVQYAPRAYQSLTPVLSPKEKEKRKKEIERCLYDVFSKYRQSRC